MTDDTASNADSNSISIPEKAFWQTQLETVQQLRRMIAATNPALEAWSRWRQHHPEAHVASIEWAQKLVSDFDQALGPGGINMERHYEVDRMLQQAEQFLREQAAKARS